MTEITEQDPTSGGSDEENLIDKAVRIVGSRGKLATELGVTPVFVSQMKTGDRAIPPRLCMPIQKLTNREVLAEQLRPDIFSEAYEETQTI